MASTVGDERKAVLNGKGGVSEEAASPSESVAAESHANVAPSTHVERNPGMPLDLDWVYGTRINRSAVERRPATPS